MHVLVTLEAQLAIGLEQQLLVLRDMGRVAGGAFAILHRLMLHFTSREVLLHLLVTFKAELPVGLEQQLLVIRLMRVVAGGTFAILHRQMFDLRRGQVFLEIVVTLEAQLLAELEYQLFVRRIVRRMARGTFAILHRLVFDFRGEEVRLDGLMAIETDLAGLAAHLLRKLRFVAGGTFLLGKRRMFEEFRPHRKRDQRRPGIGGEGGWVRGQRDQGIRGRAGLRHAVEKERKPLLLVLGAATHQERQNAQRQPESLGAGPVGA